MHPLLKTQVSLNTIPCQAPRLPNALARIASCSGIRFRRHKNPLTAGTTNSLLCLVNIPWNSQNERFKPFKNSAFYAADLKLHRRYEPCKHDSQINRKCAFRIFFACVILSLTAGKKACESMLFRACKARQISFPEQVKKFSHQSGLDSDLPI